MTERAAGVPFHDLVRQRVLEPAGMDDTAFLRSDELPARAAQGYGEIDGVTRTNVFHLPVLGSGDGGVYSTAADVSALWAALFAGRIVSEAWISQMVAPRSVTSDGGRYGLGLWLAPSTDTVALVGQDAGVSFRSVHDPRSRVTHTVISNTTGGAGPITRFLDDQLAIWA